MKEYTIKVINKLNKLFDEHPEANLRYGNNIAEQCKIIDSDIHYNDTENCIYIG